MEINDLFNDNNNNAVERPSLDDREQLTEADRYNKTIINCTVNSNLPADGRNSAEFAEFDANVWDVMRRQWGYRSKDTTTAKSYIFGAPPLGRSAKVTNLGVEVGEKQRRMHFHFQVTILHSVQNYSVVKVQERMFLWLMEHWALGDGANGQPRKWRVRCDYLDTRWANYSTKVDRLTNNSSNYGEGDTFLAALAKVPVNLHAEFRRLAWPNPVRTSKVRTASGIKEKRWVNHRPSDEI